MGPLRVSEIGSPRVTAPMNLCTVFRSKGSKKEYLNLGPELDALYHRLVQRLYCVQWRKLQLFTNSSIRTVRVNESQLLRGDCHKVLEWDARKNTSGYVDRCQRAKGDYLA
uniref:Uncharacterized protein n=1 Tax=Parascaris univalens TaxID=6257 RepID=A0A915BFJ5_PARUN